MRFRFTLYPLMQEQSEVSIRYRLKELVRRNVLLVHASCVAEFGFLCF
jgi:hypothetical protein